MKNMCRQTLCWTIWNSWAIWERWNIPILPVLVVRDVPLSCEVYHSCLHHYFCYCVWTISNHIRLFSQDARREIIVANVVPLIDFATVQLWQVHTLLVGLYVFFGSRSTCGVHLLILRQCSCEKLTHHTLIACWFGSRSTCGVHPQSQSV